MAIRMYAVAPRASQPIWRRSTGPLRRHVSTREHAENSRMRTSPKFSTSPTSLIADAADGLWNGCSTTSPSVAGDEGVDRRSTANVDGDVPAAGEEETAPPELLCVAGREQDEHRDHEPGDDGEQRIAEARTTQQLRVIPASLVSLCERGARR